MVRESLKKQWGLYQSKNGGTWVYMSLHMGIGSYSCIYWHTSKYMFCGTNPVIDHPINQRFGDHFTPSQKVHTKQCTSIGGCFLVAYGYTILAIYPCIQALSSKFCRILIRGTNSSCHLLKIDTKVSYHTQGRASLATTYILVVYCI